MYEHTIFRSRFLDFQHWIGVRKESNRENSMLVLSPPMEHTLQGQTVKDVEGRRDREQTGQGLAPQK